MALSVRNIGKFANSTCLLLSRTTFVDRENTFQSKFLLRPNFNQYSLYSGDSSSINILQKEYKNFQYSLISTENSKNEPNKINDSVRMVRIAQDKNNDKQLFSESQHTSSNKPSPEKLLKVYNTLADNLPKIFVQTLDFNIYDENIIFEDHIRNVKTVGLYNYIRQVSLLRTVGHIKFTHVQFEILKITQHPEDSTIKIRWRIRGITALKIMINFWKYKVWDFKKVFDKSESWYDGFSTFYVDDKGKVIKHIADKMMPDSDQVIESKDIAGTVKLALIVGIIPKFSEFNSFF